MEGYKDNSGFNAVFGSGGGGSSPTILQDFGSFNSLQTQVIGSALDPTLVALENTLLTNGVSVASDGTINFSNQGYYMVEATMQFFHRNALSVDNAYVWLLLNGVNYPSTTRQIVLRPTITWQVLTLNYMVRITSLLETINLIWTADSTDIELETTLSPISNPYPDEPSVICNVFQISQ